MVTVDGAYRSLSSTSRTYLLLWNRIRLSDTWPTVLPVSGLGLALIIYSYGCSSEPVVRNVNGKAYMIPQRALSKQFVLENTQGQGVNWWSEIPAVSWDGDSWYAISQKKKNAGEEVRKLENGNEVKYI